MNIDVDGLLESYDDYAITLDEIINAENRTSFNDIISEYVLRLHHDFNLWSCFGESQRIKDCSKKWGIDYYAQSNISDIRYVSHCRSKFCLHCQKLLQASRIAQFEPLLSAAAAEHDLYHIVFTAPNVPGVKLEVAVKCFGLSFRRLIRLFSGKDKIYGLDFSVYGYYAALRSFEVTYGNRCEDDFHPHIHCIFALAKGLDFKKVHKNSFSYKDGVLTDLFSDFDILLQKVWRLIYDSEMEKCYNSVMTERALGEPLTPDSPDYSCFNDIPAKKKSRRNRAVTLAAINSLDIGYDVHTDLIIDDSESNFSAFLEVFKYACKCTSENSEIMTYNQFKWLYMALKGVHIMQGYGAWSRFKSDIEDDSYGEWYIIFISWLRQRETPLAQTLTLDDVKKAIQDKSTRFITRKSIKLWLKNTDEQARTSFETVLEGVHPRELEHRYYISRFETAYCRYLHCKATSSLFADIREQEAKAKEEKKTLVLSPEQMSFLDSIF
jgi:plasmid rolling circle replication initiator protein Rep